MNVKFIFSPDSLSEQKKWIHYTKKRLRECQRAYTKLAGQIPSGDVFEVRIETGKQKTSKETIFPRERYIISVKYSGPDNVWVARETTANIFAAVDIAVEQIKYQIKRTKSLAK